MYLSVSVSCHDCYFYLIGPGLGVLYSLVRAGDSGPPRQDDNLFEKSQTRSKDTCGSCASDPGGVALRPAQARVCALVTGVDLHMELRRLFCFILKNKQTKKNQITKVLSFFYLKKKIPRWYPEPCEICLRRDHACYGWRARVLVDLATEKKASM